MPQLAPPQTFENNLISFGIQSSINGGYSGTFQFTNDLCLYDAETMLWRPIIMNLTSDATGVNCPAGPWEGTRTVLNGLVTQADPKGVKANNTARVEVRSYAYRLAKRTVNTFNMCIDAITAMQVTLNTYLSYPLGLLDIEGMTPNKVTGPIRGGNAIDELKRIAQIGCAHLYVDLNGLLTVSPWKDHNSQTEYVIPSDMIVEACSLRSLAPGPTKIVVRGGFYSRCRIKCDVGTDEPGGGKRAICIKTPIQQDEAKLKITPKVGSCENVSDVEVDADVGVIVGDDAPTSTSQSGGAPTISICQKNVPAGTSVYEYSIKGCTADHAEYTSPATRRKARGSADAYLDRGGVAYATRGLGIESSTAGPAGGGGISGGGGNLNDDRDADEFEEVRCELCVWDPGLQNQFGIIEETIENPYTCNPAVLFKIAKRRFQEFRMQRNAWRVTLPFTPQIELNQVIEFTTPNTTACAGRPVRGLVVDIDITYQKSQNTEASAGGTDEPPMVGMEITVWPFDELGLTDYVSGNILQDKDLCGVDESWTLNQPNGNDCGVGIGNGALCMESNDSSNATAEKILTELSAGATCTVSFDAAVWPGSNVSVNGGQFCAAIFSGTDLLFQNCWTSDQTVNQTFTMTDSSLEIFFSAEQTESGTAKWCVTNLKVECSETG